MQQIQIKKGINMDHNPWVIGENLADEKYMKIVKKAGFDHVRLPFPFDGKQPETTEGPTYYETIKQVCLLALKNGLVPIVDIHPFYFMNREPLVYKDAYLKMWDELAEYLRDIDESVIFELLNEPDNEYNYVLLNEIQNEAIKRVRRTNPTRIIAAATAHCNTIENLEHLILPEDDENIIVTIHDYTPMRFTHQGASWMNPPTPGNQKWGSDADYQELIDHLDMAKKWADEHHRFIHLGEFGVYSAANIDDRCAWISLMVKLCEERDFAWCHWEFWSGFGAYDGRNDCWRKPIIDALMPPKNY